MKLSIVMVNWNTRDYLLDAVGSILQNPPECDYEIIVVDNASSDGSADAVAAQYPRVLLISNTENAGYARGNNQGIQASRGAFVLLLNPDVLVPAGALSRALRVMEAEPAIGALGAKLIHPDGRVQKSIRGFPTPFAIACEAVGLARLFPRSHVLAAYRMPWFDYEKRSDVDQPMGTFLLIRREALDQVGLLDERFPVFFNEVDWCYRARRAGWRIVYVPEVAIIHYGGASTRQVAPAMAWESRRGLLTFFRKHYSKLWHAPVYWLACVTSWIQAWMVSRRRRTLRGAS